MGMNDTIDFYQIYHAIERGAHMKVLVNLILSNTELNYREDDLRIEDDAVILAFIKAYSPVQYRERLEELQKALASGCANKEEDDETV